MRWMALFLSVAFWFAPASPAFAAGNNTLGPMIKGGENIKIKNVKIIVPSANQGVSQTGGGAINWYIVTFTFTNTTAYPMIPVLTRFIFSNGGQTAVQGQVTGDPDLIGNVSNPHANDVLKPGDTYEYTVGFLTSTDQAGFIYYDRTGGGF